MVIILTNNWSFYQIKKQILISISGVFHTCGLELGNSYNKIQVERQLQGTKSGARFTKHLKPKISVSSIQTVWNLRKSLA